MASITITAMMLLATRGWAASLVGYAACVAAGTAYCAALCGTCPGCPQCVACLAAVAAACLCFDPDTILLTSHGAKQISDVHPGDYVLTQGEDGVEFHTKVEQNSLTEGNFTFITIVLDDPRASTISVTEQHGVMTYGEDGSFVILEAKTISMGQRLRVGGSGSAKVVSVERSVRSAKYALATEDCTVLANGILVGTVCMDAARSNVLMQQMPETPKFDKDYFADILKDFILPDTGPGHACAKGLTEL